MRRWAPGVYTTHYDYNVYCCISWGAFLELRLYSCILVCIHVCSLKSRKIGTHTLHLLRNTQQEGHPVAVKSPNKSKVRTTVFWSKVQKCRSKLSYFSHFSDIEIQLTQHLNWPDTGDLSFYGNHGPLDTNMQPDFHFIHCFSQYHKVSYIVPIHRVPLTSGTISQNPYIEFSTWRS